MNYIRDKLENLISAYKINEDDADWLRALESQPAHIPEGWKAVPVDASPEFPSALPNWITYDFVANVLTINGKRYAADLFGENGFMAAPGTVLRIENGPDDVVTCTTLPQASYTSPDVAAAVSRVIERYRDTLLALADVEKIEGDIARGHYSEIQKEQDIYAAAWKRCAEWAEEEHLISDIGSPAYLKDMAEDLTRFRVGVDAQ